MSLAAAPTAQRRGRPVCDICRMTTTQVIAVAATCSGLILSVAPILQVRHVLEARDSGEVSLAWVTLIAVNSMLWGAYGIAKDSAVLIIPNALGSVTNSLTAAVVFHFRPRGDKRH